MRKVWFSFRGAGVQSQVKELMEFEDDTSDDEINELLEQWLWERSDAIWWEDEPRAQAPGKEGGR